MRFPGLMDGSVGVDVDDWHVPDAVLERE